MPVDIGPTLRQAITRLQKERQQIDHQIAALETAMSSLNEGGARSTVRPGRPAKTQKRGPKRMTAAERAAVGPSDEGVLGQAALPGESEEVVADPELVNA